MNASGTCEDWKRLRGDVRRLIGRRVPAEADADDVVQEVLLRIWRHAARLRSDEHFSAWVRRVVDTTVADHHRIRQRHPLPRTEFEEEALPGAQPADASDAEAEAKRCVAAALRPFAESLAPHYRDAIVLSELEGIPHGQIASTLGLSVSAVKSRVQRGRRQLEELLTRCCEIALDARGSVVSCELRPGTEAPPGCAASPPRDHAAAAARTGSQGLPSGGV
jgi:RNA polymerase sigma-70 factor, ECF subfamily